MTKLEIITHLVAADVTRRNGGSQCMGEGDVRAAAKLADWILFVSVEDTRTPAQKARDELGFPMEEQGR